MAKTVNRTLKLTSRPPESRGPETRQTDREEDKIGYVLPGRGLLISVIAAEAGQSSYGQGGSSGQMSMRGHTRTPLNPLNPNLPMTPAMAGYGMNAGIKIERQPGYTTNIPQLSPRAPASNIPTR